MRGHTSPSPPLMIVFVCFSFSLGDSYLILSQAPAPTSSGRRESDRKYELGARTRFVVEGPSGSIPMEGSPSSTSSISSSTLVLAAERTYRKDPLDGFKRYSKGWDIRETHYWASVGFTALPLFAIAAIWFLAFGLCLLLIYICYLFRKRQPYGYSQTAYALSLVLLILCSTAAIIGCLVLYAGQGKFHSSARRTLGYVLSQADTTIDKLKEISNYLASAKLIAVDQVLLPSNVQADIDQIGAKINSSASTLTEETKENSDNIRNVLDSTRVALIVLSAAMLLLTFLGFLFSVFGMQFVVYILVIFGWVLVTGTLILSGIFVLLHNVAGDTCVAMDQWVQNPTAHTALDEILPCVDNATAQETLLRSKEVTSQMVDVVNSVITNVSNINFSPNFPSVYYNQSGPLLPVLCNPFNHDLTDRPCGSGEVNLNNATEAWGSNVCQVSEKGICTTPGRLTPALYNQMVAAVNVSYGLYNYAPFLIDLEDCTFVRETFSHISWEHCPGLRRYSKLVYVGLLIVSFAVMWSLIFFIVYGRERHQRVYTKQHMSASGQGDKAPSS